MSTAAPLPPSVVQGGLPTPDGTPEPEDARNKAEEKRKREEEKRQKEAEQAATTRFRERYDRAKSEIDRLQSSNAAEAPLAVLGVKEDDVSNITIARAFTELGCLVHYKYMPDDNQEQAKKAFNDIMIAGEKLRVDDEARKEVEDWDGKKDLLRPIWLQERYELAEGKIKLLSDAESATNPLELLGLSSETASKAAVEWKITNLGCLLHYKYMPPDEQHQQSAKKAFDALMKVGETLNVGNNLLDAVRGWNGEQDLLGPLKSAYFKDRYDRAAAKLTKLEQHTVQDDPYGVLDLTMEDATDEVTDRQFKKLGCLLHPKYMPEEKRAKVKEAFDKILKAGEVLNVDEVDREAVENWDGEEDLLQEDATRLHPTNEVPEPPEAIKKLFEEATPHMVKLRDDPSDAGARTNLEQLNLRLREATGTYIAEAGAQLSDRIWEIQIDQFAMAFQQVKDLALKLAENPADASVQANLDITKRGIDNEIALKHFPQKPPGPTSQRLELS
ncbi:dnaJ domain-containing protein [Purpureocillium lilacinum]|uniref:DnaJ domain-containing protein n=1 Tax=Purpureocillium lilacinum TaxID=33203 RepID=A0A179FAZ8_PURLI|nr:dnaJ domain-containing protein [Purpureocillium lilacinum]OAQ62598.1 dnaJ domain-containing protein [Purpureocillium lilacinum]